MTRAEIQSKLVEALKEILRQSGGSDDPVVGPKSTPIGDLPGFDSLNGEEATVLLEAELGCDLPQNVFIAEESRRALSIHEIDERLWQRIAGVGEEGRS